MTDAPEGPRLGETGQILVTQAAAREYSEARGLGVEAARRELTVLLAGARRAPGSRDDVESWRGRSRPLRVDVSAHVTREPGLAVVVHVGVRGLNARPGAGARARRAERPRK